MFHFFFFNDTATTEIYTLSLHDALPISCQAKSRPPGRRTASRTVMGQWNANKQRDSRSAELDTRSEEHTSELQSLAYLVCRLLLEKKKPRNDNRIGGSGVETHPRRAHAR